MATAADWMSAATFISMAGGIAAAASTILSLASSFCRASAAADAAFSFARRSALNAASLDA